MANAYDRFLAQTLDAATETRTPVNGSIELTFRCNLNCVMCYNNLPGNDRSAREQELSTAEIKGMLDEMANAGCLWLQLTGGEALLRPDFPELYRYAKSKGFLIRLFTNGTMITPRIADLLAEHRPLSIEVSLYGATQETYEAITRVAGSYARCLRGIHLLLDHKLPVTLKTVAITLNQHELADLQILSDTLGVPFRFDPDINPRLDGDKTPLKYRLTPEQVVRLDAAAPARARELAARACAAAPIPIPGEPQPLFNCAAGETAFHIDPYGQMSVCIMTRRPGYDLRGGTFAEGWRTFAVRRDAARVAGEETSSYHHCAGWAQLEQGDETQTVAYAARVALLRHKTFATLTQGN